MINNHVKYVWEHHEETDVERGVLAGEQRVRL